MYVHITNKTQQLLLTFSIHFNFAFHFFTQHLQYLDKQRYIYKNHIIKQLLTSGDSISDVMYPNIYIYQITLFMYYTLKTVKYLQNVHL